MQIKTDGRDGKQMGSFPIYLDEKSRDDEYNAVHASIVGQFRSSWIHGDCSSMYTWPNEIAASVSSARPPYVL